MSPATPSTNTESALTLKECEHFSVSGHSVSSRYVFSLTQLVNKDPVFCLEVCKIIAIRNGKEKFIFPVDLTDRPNMRVVTAFLLILLLSCGKQVTSIKGSSETSKLLAKCAAVAYDPGDIDELLAMINALPKPMDTECFLKALKRPLYVNASSSTMSVQPASGVANPRIFIFKGNLIIALVPSGEGSLVLEFSELKNDVRSIKGEIPLPVMDTVSASAPFSRIAVTGKTTCQGCHSSEQPEFKIGDVQVYSSKAFQPSASRDVPLSSLNYQLYLCDFNSDSSKRCGFYRALLNGGEVLPKSFPSDMPTLLDAF
jgi:hypothetical protein